MISSLSCQIRQNPELDALVVYDYLRATRPSSSLSSHEMVSQAIPGRNLKLFLHPAYTGLPRLVRPAPRAAEILGVQHMKAVVSDDTSEQEERHLMDNFSKYEYKANQVFSLGAEYLG